MTISFLSGQIDRHYWKGRRVFITGHMGFKGAWLCALLSRLGGITIGYGKDNRDRLLYHELQLQNHIHIDGDINNLTSLEDALVNSKAEIVIHLAAQPLVLESYEDPLTTFETNIMGSLKVLSAARKIPSLKSLIVITTDKVYLNTGLMWAYRESDTLGGADPYSASKAAAELVTSSMEQSFFSEVSSAHIVTARAGNVIGGGDWAKNRLLPDAAVALGQGLPLLCRNPDSIRPWQHVLDPLVGYLLLAERADTAPSHFPKAWNFGSSQEDLMTVRDVANIFVQTWGSDSYWETLQEEKILKETKYLSIDSTLARNILGWRPRWAAREAVIRTAKWYQAYNNGTSAQTLVNKDITEFLEI